VNTYELVFIVIPTVEDEGLQQQVETVTGRIAQLGGEVSKVDVWGRRRMAYPIRKFTDGQYVLLHMQMPPAAVTELERELKLAEPILRHLVIRREE
jgi:small subunit ribosomal protein S6